MKIDSMRDVIQRNHVRISDDADEEAEADELAFDEIYFSVLHGEIVEDCPDDKPRLMPVSVLESPPAKEIS